MQLISISQPSKVENLKQNIADMEEKVQYQSEERLRDIHDLLDSCHTRVDKELKGHFLQSLLNFCLRSDIESGTSSSASTARQSRRN